MAEAGGGIVWFTGLSGAGKTTLARHVQARLRGARQAAVVVDGDALRAGLSSDLGFSMQDRLANVTRAAHVARLLADDGVVALVALISPLEQHRQAAREICHGQPFVMVHVDVPLAVAEARDVKGLYRRAREGHLADLTGVQSAYEVPAAPDLRVSGDVQPLERAGDQVLAALSRARPQD